MNKDLQAMARGYLRQLRYMAEKHGLGWWVDETIEMNIDKRCEATKKEVRMLSRLCDDERLMRTDIPKVLGKSYRQCVEDMDFDKISTHKKVGIYDKVSALLLAKKQKRKHTKK